MSKDIRTLAYILRRTNYGEADRILNLITPEGKKSAIARGVRKARSKLAGAVEPFCLLDMNLHFGRGELAIVTGSKMLKYHGGILGDVERLTNATAILKRANVVAESGESTEFFEIVDQSLTALASGADVGLVRTWAELNLTKAGGEQVNLQMDVEGRALSPDGWYKWDVNEAAFLRCTNGSEKTGGVNNIVGAEIIKLMRLMLTVKLEVIMRVKGAEEMVPEIWQIVQAINKI